MIGGFLSELKLEELPIVLFDSAQPIKVNRVKLNPYIIILADNWCH